MATKNEKRVEVYIPKGYAGEEPNLFISINGVNYLLPRGKASFVPEHVARELVRSRKAQELADSKAAALEARQ